MSGKWTGFLKNSKHLQTFEADLREHLATLFEVEDELIGFVLSSCTEVRDQKQLAAEFAETFEDDAADVAAWCWEKLTQLSQQAEQPTNAAVGHSDALGEAELQDGGSEEGELAAEQPHEAAHIEQELPKKSKKREPIKFNLESTAADTAPIKASSQKSQQLRPHRAENNAAAASAEQQPKQQQQQPQQQPEHSRGRSSRADAVRGATAVVQGALQAAARSAAAAPDGKGTKDTPAAAAPAPAGPRGGGQSREQTPPVDSQQAAGSRHGRQDRQPDPVSRAAEHHRQPAARLLGAKRALADGAAGPGARGIASRALQQIGAVAAGSRTGRARRQQQQEQRQEQQQEQRSEAAEQRLLKQPDVHQVQQLGQQRRSRVSVLDRLGSREGQDGAEKGSSKHSVFERLSGLAPEAGAAPATTTEHKQAAPPPSAAPPVAAPPAAAGRLKTNDAGQLSVVANSQKQQQERIPQIPQQQQQQQEAVEAKVQRRSVSLRLDGAGSGLPEVQQQQQQRLLREQQEQEQQNQPPVGAEAAALKEGLPAQLAPAAASGTKRKAPPAAVSGAAAVNGSASTAAAAAAGNVAKKAAVSAAAGSKPQQSSQLAALRAQLAAKEAEVKQLQLQKAMQEADERSVVVFNVPPHVPEAVVRAHFGGCGPIKRCTLRGGPVGPTLPGAYIEFETTMGALAAMGLAGSFLLEQQIQVARKSDYQANQQKAQQTFAAMRAHAARKAWVKPAAAPTLAAAASAAGTGEPESPTSLGSMGLLE